MKSAMSISIPSHRLVERLRSMTDANDHSGARRTIANWILRQLRAHGFTMKDADFRRAMAFHRVFEAIATIHDELGYIPTELYKLRCRRTEEMLEFVENANHDAADAIYNTL